MLLIQLMKNTNFIFFLLTVSLLGCEKTAMPEPQLPEVDFVQRVLLEPTVSTSCGACPLMHHEVEQLAINNEQVLYMNHYTMGPLFHPYTRYQLNDVNKTVYTPLAHVNRKFEEGSMVYYPLGMITDLTIEALSEAARYAIEIETSTPQNDPGVTVSILARSEEDLGTFLLHVFLVEKEVTGLGPGYDQRNYGNDTPSHPYFGMGNWIEGFQHTNVIRDVLTPYSGLELELKDLDVFTQSLGLNDSVFEGKALSDFAIIAAISNKGQKLQPLLNVNYKSF